MVAAKFIKPYVMHGQKAAAVKKVTVSIPLHVLCLLSNERTRRQVNNLRHATNSDLLCEAFLHAFTGQPLPTDEELKRAMIMKKTTAKKPAAKKVATKVAAKKVAVKKLAKASAVTVKKTAPAKSVAKKATAKKVVVNKVAAKKAVAKNTVVKNTIVKKAPAKKTAIKKAVR